MSNSSKIFVVIPLLALALGTTACSQQVDSAKRTGANAADLNQAEICEVSGWQRDLTEKACKPGQKIVFLPQSWGNDQLPILFAAVNCDLRYSVALTNGAVTCIYSPLKTAEKQGPAPEKPKS